MEFKLNKIEKIVFALLKISLHGQSNKDIDWKNITPDEWEQCYLLSIKHGVMALVWDGIQHVISECNLSRKLKLKWAVSVLNYEEKYNKYCQTAAKLSDIFAEHGIKMVQIKGVGLSAYYPIPSHREGGDIDIYTFSANKNVLSDEKANELANEIMKKQGIHVDTAHQKHSNFKFNGIPIENHRSFVNTYTTSIGASINSLLLEVMQPKQTTLCNGNYQILTPSPAFNFIFLPFHTAQHFGVEINLHHLFDWACLLKKEGWCLPNQPIDRRFLDFIYAMTYLSNQLLGTNIKIQGSDRLVQDVFKQMMHSTYSEKIPVKGYWPVFFYKSKRLLHSYVMLRKVFDITIYKMLKNSICFHIKKLIS